MRKVQRTVPGVCGGCKYAFVQEFSNGRVRVICKNHNTPDFRQVVRRPLSFCSERKDSRDQEVFEYEKIGWLLRTDKEKRKIGFCRPAGVNEMGDFTWEKLIEK